MFVFETYRFDTIQYNNLKFYNLEVDVLFLGLGILFNIGVSINEIFRSEGAFSSSKICIIFCCGEVLSQVAGT